jgi:hypothetical protein
LPGSGTTSSSARPEQAQCRSSAVGSVVDGNYWVYGWVIMCGLIEVKMRAPAALSECEER